MSPHGCALLADGTARFRLWAPGCESVRVEFAGQAEPLSMNRVADGWHELVAAEAGVGSLYRFVLPDGMRVPDPASMYQPEDVHGPSEVVDHAAWSWTDSGWRGRPWREAVIYEMHTGTFTPEGTFRAAIDKLPHLVSLGVTALQLMPVADFPGKRNWGYDGVLPFAPDASYGRPDDLKALVDAAHVLGLSVFLDVVYNHFGPDGNYLSLYAPEFFTSRHKTPWGNALNFDGSGSRAVREFVIQNAIYWITEFHIDGLRLDAVHAIVDDSAVHILEELAGRVRAAAEPREVHLILENEENEAKWLRPDLFTAQWNDDVHHVLHTGVTGEGEGYYAEYLGSTEKLGRALAEGFAFQGEVMDYRERGRGEPSAHLAPSVFIAFLQNHDQVGNRAFGDRISAVATREAVRAAAATYLLLPQTPMLFMGEEWGASSPFPFFCDFGPELADAVRRGRREEFARFPAFQDPVRRELIPDPQAASTFESGKLDWGEAEAGDHLECLQWYRAVLAVRKQEITPMSAEIRHAGTYEVVAPGAVVVRWEAGGSRRLVLAINLSASIVSGFPAAEGRLIWQEGEAGADGTFDAWSLRYWWTGAQS